MREGYITLALGDRRYFEMAVNAALSVKAKDPVRPVALIHDGKRDLAPYRPHFDSFVELPPDPAYVGVANKLRLYDVSPFGATMYLDSDCLVVKSDMERHWERFRGQPFNMAGEIKRGGTWYGFDIAEVCRALDLPYLCVMNSGIMYFEKGDEAARVVATANAFYRERSSALAVVHQRRAGQIADEPFYGAAMARHGIAPIRYTPEEGSIMVTSWGARRYTADPAHDTVDVIKPKSSSRLGRLMPFGAVRHSPSVMHFIGLQPKDEYDRLSNGFRRQFDAEEIIL